MITVDNVPQMIRTDYEIATLATTGSIKNLKVMFTILATLELIEDCIFSERSETLGTNKTALMPDFSP